MHCVILTVTCYHWRQLYWLCVYRINYASLDNILAASAVLIVVLLYRVHASHLCVHFVLCPIPLLEVEGSAPAPSLEEEGFARPFLLQRRGRARNYYALCILIWLSLLVAVCWISSYCAIIFVLALQISSLYGVLIHTSINELFASYIMSRYNWNHQPYNNNIIVTCTAMPLFYCNTIQMDSNQHYNVIISYELWVQLQCKNYPKNSAPWMYHPTAGLSGL